MPKKLYAFTLLAISYLLLHLDLVKIIGEADVGRPQMAQHLDTLHVGL